MISGLYLKLLVDMLSAPEHAGWKLRELVLALPLLPTAFLKVDDFSPLDAASNILNLFQCRAFGYEMTVLDLKLWNSLWFKKF